MKHLLAFLVLGMILSQTKADQFAFRTSPPLFPDSLYQNFSGVLLIAKGDSIIYSQIRGYKDPSREEAIGAESRFSIGSISKQITAVLILRAVDENKISLDASIGQYLKNLRPTWKDSVKIRHLLSHTHGIQDPDKALMFKAGSKFHYGPLGYIMLSRILETVYQKSFQELADTLFKSLGMHSTGLPSSDKRLAWGMLRDSGGNFRKDSTLFIVPVASGGFCSTAGDLLKWNQALHKGHLLSSSMLDSLRSPQNNAIRNHSLFGQTVYGLGCTIKSADSVHRIGLSGYVPGYPSYCFYYPEKDISLIILCNQDPYTDQFEKTFHVHLETMRLLEVSFQP